MANITDIEIAKFFETTVQTLGNWKRSNKVGFNHRYKAYKKYYKKYLKNKDKGSKTD